MTPIDPTTTVREHERRKPDKSEKRSQQLRAAFKWGVPLAATGLIGYTVGTHFAPQPMPVPLKIDVPPVKVTCAAPKLPEVITVPVKVRVIDSKPLDK